jgi:hypothetical protein
MNFKKVTLKNGLIAYVNLDLVRSIHESCNGTCIFFSENDRVIVQETPEQILHKKVGRTAKIYKEFSIEEIFKDFENGIKYSELVNLIALKSERGINFSKELIVNLKANGSIYNKEIKGLYFLTV